MTLDEIQKRMKEIADIPLEECLKIPHKDYMELTKEFLELNRQWKEKWIPPTVTRLDNVLKNS